MLFLLNDKVIEVNAPEAHLLERWRTIGCGDPRQLLRKTLSNLWPPSSKTSF